MEKPGYPSDEAKRQKEVEKYQLLDTFPEESYDTITALMAYICEVPISLISVLDKDRNFLKSHHGIPFNEDPRDRSFCGHAILSDQNIMIVSDAKEDKRFFDNPLVTEMGVRFYAGVPLINPNGFKLGTLCVFDTQPKVLKEQQKAALVNMSKQVMLIIEERYKNIQLNKVQKELMQRNEDLKKFVYTVSHDIKSPLSNIIGITDLMALTLEGKIDEESANFLQIVTKSSRSLKNYIDGMLNFYHNEELLKHNSEEVAVQELFNQIGSIFSSEQGLEVQFDTELELIQINTGVVNQILVNLITNGIKYNTKEKRSIIVRLKEDSENYKFEIEDNGDGMDTKEMEKLFELFETNDKVDRNGQKGTGIGLASVKKLIENFEGEIWFNSTPQVGTVAHFTLPKVQ